MHTHTSSDTNLIDLKGATGLEPFSAALHQHSYPSESKVNIGKPMLLTLPNSTHVHMHMEMVLLHSKVKSTVT